MENTTLLRTELYLSKQNVPHAGVITKHGILHHPRLDTGTQEGGHKAGYLWIIYVLQNKDEFIKYITQCEVEFFKYGQEIDKYHLCYTSV